ncbi:MAG: GNAT family N-acetyltransferase [Myxococcales bacterium]|nr:GNAT family N-acetyltransferase [Myxococcales bacterium]
MPDQYLDNLNPADRLPVWRATLSQSDDVTLVAQHDGALCGFCSLVPSRDADAGAGIGEIAAIYVDPTKWHCGHGRALMLAVLDQARRTYRELTLWVLISNSRARCFYEALGFALDGGEKQDDRWGDFVLRELRYRFTLVEQ